MDYTVHGILQARILEWVVFLFSRGSSQTQGLNPGLLQIADCRRQADSLPDEPQGKPQNNGVGSLFLLQLPDPGIELGSPKLQADSLPTELRGKPRSQKVECQQAKVTRQSFQIIPLCPTAMHSASYANNYRTAWNKTQLLNVQMKMNLFTIQHPITHTQMYPVSSSESGGKSVFPLVLSQFHVDMLQTGLPRGCWL